MQGDIVNADNSTPQKTAKKSGNKEEYEKEKFGKGLKAYL